MLGQTPSLQQPKPTTPNRRYASFLKNFIDPPPPPQPISTFVSEWLKSIGSDPEKRYRSDNHLQRLGDPVSRNLTRSAPEMSYIRDADGFAVPPIPASISHVASVVPSDFTGATSDPSRPSARTLVEDPHYRDLNLAANNIYMRPLHEQFPQHISDLVGYMRRDRDSPAPSPDHVRQDAELNELWMGSGELEVEEYFKDKIFPKPGASSSLKRAERQPISKHAVPSTGSRLKLSTPVPDLLYGYNRHEAFPHQQSQLISMGTQPIANNAGLLYPFFVIEFKGDGGSMWVATNQCLGGSASCVKMADNLNQQLKHYKSDEVQSIDSASFSIAINGTEARLYISWKQDERDYLTASVKSFLLHEPEHYIEFRKYVRNIIDWGKDRRLKDIRNCLDSLLEESRKRNSEAVKSRYPPSDSGSTTSSNKKPRSSSSRKNSRFSSA